MADPAWADLLDFTGRTVVVTGAAHGIGAASARRFSEAGANVVLVDRDERSVVEQAASLDHAVALALDITTDHAPDAIVACAVEHFGGVDVVVNAAGVFPHSSTIDLPWDEWDSVIRLNLRASFGVAQACARAMTGSAGAIINVASRVAAQPNRDMAAYAASKGGVVSLTRALALDFGPTVRVNAVAPGPITDTAGAQAASSTGAAAEAATAAFAARLPLGRTGRADDVARLIVFLASDAASFITGEVVTIDGGRSLI